MIAEDVVGEAASVPVTFTSEIGGDVTVQGALGKTTLDVSLDVSRRPPFRRTKSFAAERGRDEAREAARISR